MALVVQEDQLFVLDVSKGGDVERLVSIHQDDLIMGQGRGLTELGQGIVAARIEGHLGFVMEVQSQGSLQRSSFANAVVFWVLVHSGFSSDEGSGTTKVIPVLDADDTPFVARQ